MAYFVSQQREGETLTFVLLADSMRRLRDWSFRLAAAFPLQRFVIERGTAYTDLFLMARCDHAILSFSTFAFWGARLHPLLRPADRPEIAASALPRTVVAWQDFADMSEGFLPPDWVVLPWTILLAPPPS